ncbi:MAG: putative glycolipid-binding domain-containing protein [Clostridiales bacterium]|nr:putative glycolipid-binding domain-containing protein [Clostridiales bacterium]
MPWEWRKDGGRYHLFRDGEPVASLDVELAEEWAHLHRLTFQQPRDDAWREILSYWRGQGVRGVRVTGGHPKLPGPLHTLDFQALPFGEDTFLWHHAEGAHHLAFRGKGWTYEVRGITLGQKEGRPFRAEFSWEGGVDWSLRRLALRWGAQKVVIHRDGAGKWRSKDGRLLPGTDDAQHLFLWLTPFSHTAALRFLAMRPELKGTFLALELIPVEAAAPLPAEAGASFGQLLLRQVRHRYEPLGDGRYRWSRDEAGHQAILRTDDEGWLWEGGGWRLLAKEKE